MKSAIKYFLCISACGPISGIHAQHQAASFEMTLFFEDAIGNKDTLEIGYDTSAANALNPDFGEVPILQPFDSMFEVRATHDWQNETIKRIIDRPEFDDYSGCASSNGIWIFINAKNYPITITYDSAHLNSTPCHTDAVLSPTWTLFAYPDWLDAEMLFCMSTTDRIVDDFTYYFDFPSAYLQRQFEVEGEGVKFLRGYFFVIFWPSGNCVSLVNNNELFRERLSLFPNPVKDQLTLSWADAGERNISIIDLYGRIASGPFQAVFEEIILDTRDLSSGQYFVVVMDREQITTEKVVIVD